MKIQYCSDLHLEIKENQKIYSNRRLINPTGEILIILGDFLALEKDSFNLSIFDDLSRDFKTVFWVPGNHEYRRGFNINQIEDFSYIYAVRYNVFLINNQVVIYENVKLIFSTMWSNIIKHNAKIEKEIPDYNNKSVYGNKILTIADTNRFHKKSIDFIKKNTHYKSDYITIVCTHYPPSKKCDSPDYSFHHLNEAFYSELDSLIMNSNIDYWLYGHTHYNQNDFFIGNTIMSTNQLGYVTQQLVDIEEPKSKIEFEISKTIDI